MMEKDVMHVRVNGHLIGLAGFKEAMTEVAETRIGKTDTDETIQQALLDRLSAKNYIPANARQSYGLALLKKEINYGYQDTGTRLYKLPQSGETGP